MVAAVVEMDEYIKKGSRWTCRNCGTTVQVTDMINVLVEFVAIGLNPEQIRSEMYGLFVLNNEKIEEENNDE
jgi:hypothetical protein